MRLKPSFLLRNIGYFANCLPDISLSYFMIMLTNFPDPENNALSQIFTLDQDNLHGFRDSYIKLLGGLLVDQQTFVIEEVDSTGNFVRHLLAFNIFGALDLDPGSRFRLYVPRPTAFGYVSAPIVTTFDDTLYDEADPNSIVNILNGFYENNNLISYQRIGNRREELIIWQGICNSLSFIDDFF